MADVLKQEEQLKLLAGFTDGDERTITMPNPRADLTAADINAVGELAKGVLIGDKYGAPFLTFKDANTYDTTTIKYDLKM